MTTLLDTVLLSMALVYNPELFHAGFTLVASVIEGVWHIGRFGGNRQDFSLCTILLTTIG